MIWGRAICMAVWFMLTSKPLTATVAATHQRCDGRAASKRPPGRVPRCGWAVVSRRAILAPLLALCSLAAGPYLHPRGDLSGVALGELRAVSVAAPVDRLAYGDDVLDMPARLRVNGIGHPEHLGPPGAQSDFFTVRKEIMQRATENRTSYVRSNTACRDEPWGMPRVVHLPVPLHRPGGLGV